MKEPKIFLQHILESIKEIENYTKGISNDKFLKNKQLQDALVRRLEIIGEAVRNLPNDFRNDYSEIPWSEMAGMRDILIHEYFGVDLNLVWKTIKEDIPNLKEKIKEILD